jgi:hypothetical protein
MNLKFTKFVLVFLTLLVMLYGAIAFVVKDLNALSWSQSCRFWFVIVIPVIFILSVFFADAILTDNDTEK